MMEAAFGQTNNIQEERRRGVRRDACPWLDLSVCFTLLLGLASWVKLTV